MSYTDARLGKYLVANDKQISLLGYDAEKAILYTAIGSDLPGLYGRTVCLESGLPPQRARDLVEYHNVRPQVAAKLDSLLMK